MHEALSLASRYGSKLVSELSRHLVANCEKTLSRYVSGSGQKHYTLRQVYIVAIVHACC